MAIYEDDFATLLALKFKFLWEMCYVGEGRNLNLPKIMLSNIGMTPNLLFHDFYIQTNKIEKNCFIVKIQSSHKFGTV